MYILCITMHTISFYVYVLCITMYAMCEYCTIKHTVDTIHRITFFYFDLESLVGL